MLLMTLPVVLVVLVPLTLINCVLVILYWKQVKSTEERIIVNIINLQKELSRLNSDTEQILTKIKNIPKEITIKNVLKLP
jgi:hypothetical protein